MATYQEIIERIISGVVKDNPQPPPFDRLRMAAEMHLSHVLSQVAEAFAAREDRRTLLKQVMNLPFTSGISALPDKVLKKYLKDASLEVSDAKGPRALSFVENYHDYLKCVQPNQTPDARLGYWSVNGSTVYAVPRPGATLNTADFTVIFLVAPCVPDLPAAATDTFTGPNDMLPEIISASIETLRGQPVDQAAEAA